jgi:hypothetical protein
MSDLFDGITEDQDPIKRLASKIPGFGGYIERQNRRAADKLLRELISSKYSILWKKVGTLQADLANSGELMYLDDLETAATKLQTFTDKIENASYGYSSFFDAVKINEEELTKIYEFDESLLSMEAELANAIGNVETSIGTDGLPASIRHLVKLSTGLVEKFDGRDQLLVSIS